MSETPNTARLDEIERLANNAFAYFSPIKSLEMLDWIIEIRRLRAENVELRASYDRVEKYAAELRKQIDGTD